MEKYFKIFERKDFSKVPQVFWDKYTEWNKQHIIQSGYPIIPIRIGICDEDLESEMYKALWNIKEKENDATFFNDGYHGELYIALNSNTIEFYLNDIINIDPFQPYEKQIMKNCSSCTPQQFTEKTQQDIFEIFDLLEEGQSKTVSCECGNIEISKVNDRLKINKIEE